MGLGNRNGCVRNLIGFTSVQTGFSPTRQLHGYSGLWHTEIVHQVWRRIASNQRSGLRDSQWKYDSADCTGRREWHRHAVGPGNMTFAAVSWLPTIWYGLYVFWLANRVFPSGK